MSAISTPRSQFWPQKAVIFSYEQSEFPNGTNVDPVPLYLGNSDAALGGPQQRIRADVGLGLGSIYISHFTKTSIDGTNNPSLTGWNVAYDQTLPSILWSSTTVRFARRLLYRGHSSFL